MEVYPFRAYKLLLRDQINFFVSHYCPNKNNVNMIKTTVLYIVFLYCLIIVARNKMFRFFHIVKTCIFASLNLQCCTKWSEGLMTSHMDNRRLCVQLQEDIHSR